MNFQFDFLVKYEKNYFCLEIKILPAPPKLGASSTALYSLRYARSGKVYLQPPVFTLWLKRAQVY